MFSFLKKFFLPTHPHLQNQFQLFIPHDCYEHKLNLNSAVANLDKKLLTKLN